MSSSFDLVKRNGIDLLISGKTGLPVRFPNQLSKILFNMRIESFSEFPGMFALLPLTLAILDT